MNHKPYNGWYNYETWCFNVWYGTDQFQEPIAEMLEHYVHREDDILTPEDRHIICLRDYLKEWMEEVNSHRLNDDHGFLADILGAGLQEINWFELAKNYYEGYVEEHVDRS